MAALSWRLPARFNLIRPRVLPDNTGIGAVPACMANLASFANRPMPAVSATILAALSGPQPGSSSRRLMVDQCGGLTLQRVDPCREVLDVGQQLASQPAIDPGRVGQERDELGTLDCPLSVFGSGSTLGSMRCRCQRNG